MEEWGRDRWGIGERWMEEWGGKSGVGMEGGIMRESIGEVEGKW